MLPSTVLFNILVCLKRRDLDVLELVDHAFGAAIATHENHLPRRSLSLMFFNEGAVSMISFKDTMKHVPVVDLPQYLPHAIITKMLFRSHTWTEEMYQALPPCRAHLVAEAVCDFRSLLTAPNILRSALTEVFMCNTLVFPKEHRYSALGESLAALPCVANCTNLQIASYDEAFFDAKGAFEWLLGTHAAATGVKHLSIGAIDDKYQQVFLKALVVAIEQQFIHATTPASFTVVLRCSVERSPRPGVGATRELENVVTNEQLEVIVDTSKASKTTVAIHRKPAA